MCLLKSGATVDEAYEYGQYVVSPSFSIHGSNESAATATRANATSPSVLSATTPVSPAAASFIDSREGLSIGAKAGIGVGAALGALLLITTDFLLALLRFKKKHSTNGIAQAPTPPLLPLPSLYYSSTSRRYRWLPVIQISQTNWQQRQRQKNFQAGTMKHVHSPTASKSFYDSTINPPIAMPER